jgi:S-DNA-T family DNA segregation ATPase FtsK/SpoIIIE
MEGPLAAAGRRLDKEQRELEESLAKQRKSLEKKKTEREADWRPSQPEAPVPPKAPPKPEPEVVVIPPEPVSPPVPPVPPVVSPPEPVVAETPVKAPAARGTKVKDTMPAVPVGELTRFDENYTLPSLDLLASVNKKAQVPVNEEELKYNLDLVVYTLKTFGIEVDPVGYTPGATITRYEVLPRVGVRVDKITSLQRDLARAMKAERINILAPVPGKDTVGIEIPNTSKVPVILRELFETPEWKSTRAKIPLALGKDVYGGTLVADLADMPHLLIAGTTGSGKSVCINCILLSLLYRFSPNDLRLILVDPKQVEMQIYNSIPHLVVPVVVEPKKVLMALRWVINEMEQRYKILAKTGVRNISAFNARPPKPKEEPKPEPTSETLTEEDEEEGQEVEVELFPVPPKDELEIPERLPYIVVIIDELADLMQTAPADVEAAIARLTAKARAAGIHLIVATQTPRREVVTGVIKTNIPCRIAFQVPSALDSRVILDESGAENLLGKGDMLYVPPGSGKFTRGQGAFVGDEEVHRIVEYCAKQAHSKFESEIHQKLNRGEGAGDEEITDEDKELILKCVEIIRQEKKASTSMLQRRLRIGYNRGAWVIDWLERKGVLAPSDNSAKPRDILIDLDQLDPENLF